MPYRDLVNSLVPGSDPNDPNATADPNDPATLQAQANKSGDPYALYNGGVNAPSGSEISNTLKGIPGVGETLGGITDSLLGGVIAPKTYDVGGNLALSTSAAGIVYNAAMDKVRNPTQIQAQTITAPGAVQAQSVKAQGVAAPNMILADQVNTPQAINAQTLNAPSAIQAQNVSTPDAIQAQNVQASQLLQGDTADATRAQQLAQAQTAANSSSSAAAQMRAAGTQIENQQAGMAAQARGSDRAGARRDAMLATGTQGMAAASTTSALAAQEQAAKQQAYTQALAGVRAGDVNAASTLANIGQANQAANLQAQATTGAQSLTAQQANQAAGLQGQIATGQQALTAGQANQATNLQAQTTTGAQLLAAQQTNQAANLQAQTTTGAQGLAASEANQAANLQAAQANQTANLQAQTVTGNQYLTAAQANQNTNLQGQQYTATNQNASANTALQAVGATNQAQGVAATAAGGQDALKSKTGGSLLSGLGSALGVSDERAKTNVGGIGDSDLDALMSSSYEKTPDLAGVDNPGNQPGAGPIGQNFLNWQMPKPPAQQDQPKSGVGGLMDSAKGLLSLSDERAKQQVERMHDDDVADWAEAVPTATWRYKRGIPGTDGGQDVHAGTLAGALQKTGPLGELMVHQDPRTGLKAVEYGPLGLMVGKGALAKANHALDWAKAAYALASRKGGLVNG